VVLILLWVAFVAATVGGEASKMDTMLKADMAQRMDMDAVEKQITDAGFKINEESPDVKATGPDHSMVVYSTHLTLDLTFDRSGVLTSYHLDRV